MILVSNYHQLVPLLFVFIVTTVKFFANSSGR